MQYIVPSGSMMNLEESENFSLEIGMEIKYEHIINVMPSTDSLDMILSNSHTNYLTVQLSQASDETYCSLIDTILHVLCAYKVVLVQLDISFVRAGAQFNALLLLLDALKYVPCRTLNISNQILKKSPELLQLLFPSPKNSRLIPHFQNINIAGNKLVQSQTLSILQSSTSNNSQYICSLTLDSNIIDYKGAQSLCDWIQRGEAKYLQYLSLCDCSLEVNMTPTVVAKTPLVMIANVLSTCQHAVRELNLSKNIRANKQLPSLVFQLLSRQNALRRVHFNENKVSNSDMESVAWFIECSKLQHLSLSHCYLNDEDIIALVDFLNGPRELVGLDISDNQLTDFALIAQALIRPTAHGIGLKYINLSGNRPTFESFTQFSAWLTHARSLKTLVLDNCSIDCDMLSILCSRVMIYWLQQKQLPSHRLLPPLHTLSIQRNLIGHRGAQMMAQMMNKCRPNHPLRVINMSSNHIGTLGMSKLYSCLQNDRQLLYLDVSKCDSDETVLFSALEEVKFKLVPPPTHIMKAIYLCLRRTKIGTADLIRYIISFLLIEIQRKIIV